MCNTTSALHQRNFNNLVEPFSFSTFHFLRTRNRLMLPNTDHHSHYYNLIKDNQNPIHPLDTILSQQYDAAKTPPTSPILDVIDNSTIEAIPLDLESTAISMAHNETSSEKSLNFVKSLDTAEISPNTVNPPGPLPLPNMNILPLPGSSGSTALLNNPTALPAFEYLTPAARGNISPVDFPLMELNRVGGIFPSFLHRRPRGEKRPIPDEQKDDKYYERRKRNNEAAKKSRDARKIREDRIAFRAAFLEQENSLLRAQVMALRDELQTMRQIINRNNIAANQALPGARNPAGLL